MRWRSLIAGTFAFAVPSGAEPANYNDMFGAWSSDGRSIAFTSDRTGDPEIYVVNIDGGGLERLTTTPGRDAHPSWSKDGRSLLFQSPREGGQVRIFRMNADGTNQHSVAATNGFCGVASLSPDGRQIAFQCSASLKSFGTTEAPWRIYMLTENEMHLPALTQGPRNDQVPNWSPDGRHLLFFSDRSGLNQLYELDLRTRTTKQLTFPPASHFSASYSPDGDRIALMSAHGAAKADVYVMNRRSRRLDRLTTSGPDLGTPAWSPDGKRLLIQMPTPDGWRLFTIDSESGGPPKMISFR